MEQLWDILNKPFSILLLGSGLGFLFVKLVWEPFKAREACARRRQAIRDEAEIRFLKMDQNIATTYNNIEGRTADSLDPVYKQWTLEGIICAGWGRDALRRCQTHIDRLRLGIAEADRANPRNVKEVHDALSSIRQLLGLPAI